MKTLIAYLKLKYNLITIVICVSVSVNEIFAQNNGIRSVIPDDPGLEVPILNTSPLPEYDYDRLDFGMNIGIERTPKGRIWACWVGGGDSPEAFFVLATSDNDGRSWSKPRLVIDPHDARLNENRITRVGNLWLDPLGCLWLFFDQTMLRLNGFDGRGGTWYTICENPDSDTPVWSKPVRIWHGYSLNKPTVLSDGSWFLNISLWGREWIKDPYMENYHELDSLRMLNVFASFDQGRTWKRQGGVCFPQPNFDEAHIIERKDGTLWMTARTLNGIWESISEDKGKTWSEPEKYLEHTNSRHFIRRLQSGNLLLIKHGKIDERTESRSQLTAFLSEDDGRTWIGSLVLDERNGVSYPDGFQAQDGAIYISYDRNRATDAEILMARFREKDILAGKFASRKARAKILISRPSGIK